MVTNPVTQKYKVNPMPAHKIRKSYVETSRGLVHLQESGSGPRTIALVTITSFGTALLDVALPLLAARGYHAMAFDLMGYGRSDKRDGYWLVKDFADNIEEAFASHGVAPQAMVFGHFAGWTGVEIASRQPKHLRALLLDGTPYFSAAKRAALQTKGLQAPIAWDVAGSHALEYWKRSYSIIQQLDPDTPLAAQPSEKYRNAYMALLETKSYEPDTMAAAMDFDIDPKLPQIQVPTLVMCSDTDWNLPHHPTLLTGIPGAIEHRWAGPHPLHQIYKPERAVEYVNVLDRFFAPLLDSKD